MKLKTTLISFLIGLLFWLGLNGSVDKDVLVTGVIVSFVVALFFTKSTLFEEIHFSPKAFIAVFHWAIVFIVELTLSNIDITLRMLSPKLKITPAIIEVKTNLTSKLGRLALANSITLTPGTLSVDIEGDRLYIHWIDATATDLEGATKAIVSKFEKPLEVIFG